MWAAIGISALLFGLGHLPAVSALLGHLSSWLVLYIVLANSVFGVMFGFLYWRLGLESAMLAHALSHAVFLLLLGQVA
jgi:membrane protease YdiL (CAAX protease family)